MGGIIGYLNGSKNVDYVVEAYNELLEQVLKKYTDDLETIYQEVKEHNEQYHSSAIKEPVVVAASKKSPDKDHHDYYMCSNEAHRHKDMQEAAMCLKKTFDINFEEMEKGTQHE